MDQDSLTLCSNEKKSINLLVILRLEEWKQVSSWSSSQMFDMRRFGFCELTWPAGLFFFLKVVKLGDSKFSGLVCSPALSQFWVESLCDSSTRQSSGLQSGFL